MRKNLYYILVSFTIIFFVLIIVFARKPKKPIQGLIDRKGSIALSAEWLDTKKAIENLLATIAANSENNIAKLNLAQAYIQEARITGNHAYYDQAALELLDEVIIKEPQNFDALCCKSIVLLSQHHFSEAMDIANVAVKINPNSAYVYGILCDANLELGNYDKAVSMSDKMISIRPDIRSYSRISYLREIHGDFTGAIEAAKLAVAAGYPGLEQTVWTRMILAHLYENTGHIDSAQFQYKYALQERPNYAFAIAGLAHTQKAKGNYKQAIKYLENAKSMIIEYSFSDELTDLYFLNNEKEKAQKSAKDVIGMLSPMANSDESSNAHGHYADKELAYAYLKINDTENALKHAKLEYNRRPNNIDVCETMAWVLYKKGEFIEANKLINHALRTNSKNPTLLCRAGLIKFKAGDKVNGKKLISDAFSINKYMLDISLKNEALSLLNLA